MSAVATRKVMLAAGRAREQQQERSHAMSNMLKAITFAALTVAVVALAPAVLAEQNPPKRDQSPSMMDGMQGGGMMGMMNMMGRSGEMMDGCSNMMQSHRQPPNSQFRKHSEEQQKD